MQAKCKKNLLCEAKKQEHNNVQRCVQVPMFIFSSVKKKISYVTFNLTRQSYNETPPSLTENGLQGERY